MIVVDDSSSDESAELLERLMGRYAQLRVVQLAERSGQSAALAAGFDAARGRLIVTADADLQNDPADLTRLLEMAEQYDLVCGWRRDRHDPLWKRLVSRIANARRRHVLDDGVHDTGCGLKLFRREVTERILRFDGMHRFFPALAQIEGFRIGEVPVRHRPRAGGRTKYHLFNRLRKPIGDLRGVAWYRSRKLRYVARELNRPAQLKQDSPPSRAA